MADAWPFGSDAKQDDPLTAFRIPVVTSFNPSWRYVAAYLGTSADTGNTFDPPWPFASTERPTDTEAQMLVSYLQEHRHYWFGGSGYARQMDKRPLDVDGGWNTVVFIKYGPDDWGYRRCSWTYGPTFVPGPPTANSEREDEPLSLVQVMDRVHTVVGDPMKHWTDWKAQHPDVFPVASQKET
ncbi:hypothetical protein [Streptomyces sp. NPDC005780]|uniref:hypothetical protein n=1 Tax=Streptomyces sp. NPDC005780 TaxID=3364730 RepID=UPI0036A2ABC2